MPVVSPIVLSLEFVGGVDFGHAAPQPMLSRKGIWLERDLQAPNHPTQCSVLSEYRTGKEKGACFEHFTPLTPCLLQF